MRMFETFFSRSIAILTVENGMRPNANVPLEEAISCRLVLGTLAGRLGPVTVERNADLAIELFGVAFVIQSTWLTSTSVWHTLLPICSCMRS